MTEIFLRLLNMSITAGWLILAVILLRASLKKMPKWGRCILWAMVAVRLVLPFSFESMFSLIPNAEPVSPEIIYSGEGPVVNTGIPVMDEAEHPEIKNDFQPLPVKTLDPMQVLIQRATYLWFSGMILMLVYALFSYLQLRKRVRTAMRYYDTVEYYEAIHRHGSVWICDEIDTPFILGVIKPRIYLPSNLEEMQLQYVLAHENIHLKRHDHWWKPLGFMLLSIYWFHPLIWVAYILLCRDIELACDESVVKNYELEDKKAYSNALLACSVKRHLISACPVAFGEVGVKERVKGVLNYKKPSFWIVLVTVLLCITGMVCFLTNPVKQVSSELETAITEAILQREEGRYKPGEFACEAHEILAVKNGRKQTTVYAIVMYSEYSRENGEIIHESGSHMPIALTFARNAEEYFAEEYWMPKDGSFYADSVREKFPVSTWLRVFNLDRYSEKHSASCLAQAEAWFATQYEEEQPETEIPTTEALTIAVEEKLWPLSEFAVDLTGDGVEEKIVLSGYGVDENDARQKTWSTGQCEVNIHDGEKEDIIRETYTFAGVHAGNGNLAVVEYDGQNCLLSYGNPVYQGIGNFHYQVLRLPQQGIFETVAENYAEYAMNESPLTGTMPYLGSEEAYEIIHKIETELDAFLQADTTTILVNASMDNSKCYFYEEGNARSQTGFDVFCQEVESTANSMEELFEDFRKRQEEEQGRVFNTTPDENGCYDYLPPSYYEDAYAKARTYYGEDFLEKYYQLVKTKEADVSEAPGKETIEVYTGNRGDGDGGFVLIKDANGKLLWSEEANVSKNYIIRLVNSDDMEYDSILVDFMDFGITCAYCLYRLTEGGMIVKDCAGIDVNEDGRPLNSERLSEWAQSMGDYLENAELLLSSQGGMIRTEESRVENE